MNFLDYYRENLAHIRGIAAEFAAEFPKIAARLELNASECKDPYVERLLEGTAFLAARVEKKLADGHPRLLESLVNSVSPLAVTPIPSYCIIKNTLNLSDERLKRGALLKCGSHFSCTIPGINTPCTYSTLSTMTIHPLEVSEASYVTREMTQFHLNETSAAVAALQLTIRQTVSGIDSNTLPDSLDFFINLPENESSALQAQMIADMAQVYIRQKDDYSPIAGISATIPNNVDELEKLFSIPDGLRTLQMALVFPQAFKYIRLTGLKKAFLQSDSDALELVFTFKRRENDFTKLINASTFNLWCIPAVNVFEKRTDRSPFNGNYEQHLIPDRTAPQDYEVYKVLNVEAYNDHNETLFKSMPCGVSNIDARLEGQNSAFFIPHRRERLTNGKGVRRSSYSGTEVFVAIAGEEYTREWEYIQQFNATVYCTNRDLPLLIRQTDAIVPPAAAPFQSSTFLVPPSAPHPAPCLAGAQADWDKVSHISFNLSSALHQSEPYIKDGFRHLICAYGIADDEVVQRLAEGIVEVNSVPKTFRFIRRGCVYYETGWSLELTLQEANYAGTGVFLFAFILKELVRAYTPINSCTELIFHTDKRKEIMVWNI